MRNVESACSLLRKATAISARAMNANVVGGRRTTTATNHMPFDWEPACGSAEGLLDLFGEGALGT